MRYPESRAPATRVTIPINCAARDNESHLGAAILIPGSWIRAERSVEVGLDPRTPNYAPWMHGDGERDLSALFGGFPETLAICRRIEQVVATVGEASVNVTKSQVAFRRRRGFAWVWRPGQYVKSAVPAVLSIALPREVKSDRFKSVVHPSTKVWMHHIELHDVSQIDDQIRGWLGEAYADAG